MPQRGRRRPVARASSSAAHRPLPLSARASNALPAPHGAMYVLQKEPQSHPDDDGGVLRAGGACAGSRRSGGRTHPRRRSPPRGATGSGGNSALVVRSHDLGVRNIVGQQRCSVAASSAFIWVVTFFFSTPSASQTLWLQLNTVAAFLRRHAAQFLSDYPRYFSVLGRRHQRAASAWSRHGIT